MDNKIGIICILLILVYCISAVSAADLNQTDSNIKLNEGDDVSVGVSSDDLTVKSDDCFEGVNVASGDSLNDGNDFSCNITSSDELKSNDPVVYDNLSDVSLYKNVANFYVNDSKQLNDIFSFIKDKNPSWGMLNITLAPDTVFKVGHDGLYDYDTHYAVRFNFDMVTITGNPGSVIYGDGNAFMYATPNCQLGIFNVTFENFNKVFVSLCNIFCSNSSFNKNKHVIINQATSVFENCHFNKDDGEAGVLDAKEGSLTIFYKCNYTDCGDAFISSAKFSNIIIHSESPINDGLKNCKLDSFSYLSIVSSETKDNVTVFNCSNENQLNDAVKIINTFSPSGKIVINLEPNIYEINANNLFNAKKMHPDEVKSKDDFYYYLKVSFAPVVINGNGSIIEINDGDEHSGDVFADIGSRGALVLNNVTLSKFNRVFFNLGTVVSCNCSFINNFGTAPVPDKSSKNDGSILFSNNGNTYFENCIFNNNYNKCSSMFDLEYSNLFLKNCNFDKIISSRDSSGNVGYSLGSDVYCSPDLWNTFAENKNDVPNSRSCYYHNIDVVTVNNHTFKPGDVLRVSVVNQNYESKLNEYMAKITPNVLIMNVSCDCSINLNDFNSLKKLIIIGNGHKVLFNSCTIPKRLSVTFENLTFKGYLDTWIFENNGAIRFDNCCFKLNINPQYTIKNLGTCTFENCTFTSNYVKYMVYSEGVLLVNNCSFIKNHINKNGNDHYVFFSNGVVLIYNSTFEDCRFNELVMNYNSANCVIFNCHGIKEKDLFSHPEDKTPKKKKSWLSKLYSAMAIGLGAVVGSVVFALTGNPVAGIVVGALVGGLAGLGCAYVEHRDQGVDFKSAALRYIPEGVIGGIIGGGTDYVCEEALPYNPTSDVLNDIVQNVFDEGIIKF